MADPPDNASEELAVLPSTETDTVPVGMAETELEAAPTLMVTTSLAPDEGVVVAAESVVVEPSRVDVDIVAQAESRLYRSTEPRPEASS